MPIYSCYIDMYTSMLKSEVIKLVIVAAVLVIIFISIIVYSIIQIKSERTKKLPYIQLVLSIAIFIFLSISLGSQIVSFAKDISEEAYIQYEGPANIRTEKQIIFGGIPTGYIEYILSFENNGEQIQLSMRKDFNSVGDIEKIYIVYSKHSKFVLEIAE